MKLPHSLNGQGLVASWKSLEGRVEDGTQIKRPVGSLRSNCPCVPPLLCTVKQGPFPHLSKVFCLVKAVERQRVEEESSELRAESYMTICILNVKTPACLTSRNPHSSSETYAPQNELWKIFCDL
jgi:hypothetical protein